MVALCEAMQLARDLDVDILERFSWNPSRGISLGSPLVSALASLESEKSTFNPNER